MQLAFTTTFAPWREKSEIRLYFNYVTENIQIMSKYEEI